MRSIKLNVNESIYNHIMFLLNNLNSEELKIVEDKEIKEVKNIKQSLKNLFANKNVEMFKSIKDPVKWQEKQRLEWEK